MYIIKWHKAWHAKRERNRKLFFSVVKNVNILVQKVLLGGTEKRGKEVICRCMESLITEWLFWNFHGAEDERSWCKPIIIRQQLNHVYLHLGISPLTRNSPCWSAQAPSSHRNRLPKFPVGKSAAAEAGRRAAHFSAADSSWYCGADQKVLTKGWKINSSFKALMGYLGKNGKNMAKFSFNCSPYVTEKKLCFECKQNKCLLSIDFFLVSFSHCADEGVAFHGPASMQG